MQNVDLTEKKRNIIKYKKFIFTYKNVKRTFDFYAILKLIKINFTVIRLLSFWEM